MISSHLSYNDCLRHAINLRLPATGREEANMAKDSNGRKFNRIAKYERVQNGKTIVVSAHIRSNRNDCKGQKKK